MEPKATNQSEASSPAVTAPERQSKQGEETWKQRWLWVEHSVWGTRMQRTLERGIEGGKWYALIDKVYAPNNLRSAYWKVRHKGGSAGVDGQSVTSFAAREEHELQTLSQELRTQSYRPQAVKRVWIPKPGSAEQRPLGVPAVRDRVVQGALRNVIEPIFERDFAEDSYGFRPGRGCFEALGKVEGLLQAGKYWVVDADIKGYFDSIPQDRLMERIATRISDGRVLKLIESYLKAGILEELKGWQASETGTPQGAGISPLLANIYLDPLDQWMIKHGYQMVRYADDFVILTESEAQAQQALEAIRQWMQAAQLQLHPEKTRIVDARQAGGFDFLGYHFERGQKWPRQKSLRNLRQKLKERTRRTNGQSLECIIAGLNPILRGWYHYFRYSKGNALQRLDGWVRGRLRSILRKRAKRKGRARGTDHQRWPNRFFDEAGLFNLTRVRYQWAGR
jgi:RNA-directed DNA polymerase